MKVAVIGASNKPDRYSYKALKLLKEKGHTVFPVNPILKEIEGCKVYPALKNIDGQVEVVTLYLGPANQTALAEQLLEVRPQCVIFNPGTENPELIEKLAAAGIKTLEACTLVLLNTAQFEAACRDDQS